MPKRLYLFLDEGGNFDFSSTGTCYYTFTCVTMEREFPMYQDLDHYKYDVIEFGKDLNHFHCTEDNSHVRGKVFEIIRRHIGSFTADSIIVRKCKTGPALQEPSEFYARMLGYLIQHIISRYDLSQIEEVIVITDNLPLRKKRDAFQKAIQTNLARMLQVGARYRILHHNSAAHYGLQIADYCNWAIFKKWEAGSRIFYETIKPAIKSEFDIFRTGARKYYEDGRPI